MSAKRERGGDETEAPPARSRHGVLVIDKPGGMTSHDVVARVRRVLRTRDVGHTGTLDPMATGVLPLVVGEGTKLVPFLAADDKEYEGELELGVSTDTLDVEGAVVERRDASSVDADALRAAMRAWIGEREQVPPMFSAIKHGGRPLHELARRGVEVPREARRIRVERFELVAFDPPRARFVVACSKGTYVRALARDVGEALGCGAMLTALRRTRAGRFAIDEAVPLREVGEATPMIPLPDAVGHLPAIVLTPEQVREIRFGRPIVLPPATAWVGGHIPHDPDTSPLRLLTPSGDLAALARARGDGRLAYLRVFNYGLTSP